MDEKTQKEVDAFVELPRAQRRVEYASLSREAQIEARKIIEKRRGIAGRTEKGEIILEKDTCMKRILDANAKLIELPKRMETIKENIESLKKQLLENYGDEALTEVEEALESLTE